MKQNATGWKKEKEEIWRNSRLTPMTFPKKIIGLTGTSIEYISTWDMSNDSDRKCCGGVSGGIDRRLDKGKDSKECGRDIHEDVCVSVSGGIER